jgi:hypothetical protein
MYLCSGLFPKFYQPVNSDEEDPIISEGDSGLDTTLEKRRLDETRTRRWDKSVHLRREFWPAVGASILAILLVITVLITTTSRRGHIIYPDRWDVHEGGSRTYHHCGNSPEEAKTRGCVWDLMSYSWVHPACYNKAESDEWIANYGPWDWYPQRNSTKSEVLKDEVLPYSPLVWTQQGYHVVHCLYIWKLLHLAGMNGHLVTDEGIPFQHTDHCVKMISNSTFTTFDTVNTKVHLGFGKCVSLD